MHRDKAPISVANFLQYVDKGHYDVPIETVLIKSVKRK
jgi:cyclophilin family peptidyl-prolyl cis-trans isomerase